MLVQDDRGSAGSATSRWFDVPRLAVVLPALPETGHLLSSLIVFTPYDV
jgi:hypothetical protein